eukprot:gene16896-22385_t
MSKPLQSLIQKLAESLEDKPDSWFNNPTGWLYKPNFKRESQEKASVIEHANKNTTPFSWKRLITGSPYKKRWFRLDMSVGILNYYKSEVDAESLGDIDLSIITDIQYSQVFDAPEFSLDLISADRHYTVAAESHSQMVRWAYAFTLVLNAKTTAKSKQNIQKSVAPPASVPNEKWLRYDYTYEEPGPLYLNVMGTCSRTGAVLKNWISVISFEPEPSGRPGRSERGGVISVGDYVVGVNDLDITQVTFNDAMDKIIGASWPKTLHFLRDNEKTRVTNRKEGWLHVFYPALNRKRRRYVEIRNENINFRKPGPGGAALSERDAFIPMNSIYRIKPFHDKTMSSEQSYVLRLYCKEGAVVQHTNENDESVATSSIEILELYFEDDKLMNSWRSALISPLSISEKNSNIAVDPLETIEVSHNLTEVTTDKLAIKSTITNRFSPREFTLIDGTLKWRRINYKNVVNSKKENTLFLGNSSICDIKSIKAMEDPSIAKGKGYRYQLSIQTSASSIVICMLDEATLRKWLNLIKEVIKLNNNPDLINHILISEHIENVDTILTIDDDNDDIVTDNTKLNNETSDNNSETPNMICGYLYRRVDKSGISTGGSKAEYRKNWFILSDYYLRFYKSYQESRSIALAIDTIDLRLALAVRESADPASPENAFEILTPSKVYIFIAEDEDELYKWIDAISDILETRYLLVDDDNNDNDTKVDRLKELQRAVVYSGELQMKRLNRLTQTITWRDRFIVIVAGSIYYYENQNDFYDDTKSCTGEIPIVAITQIETSFDPKCSPGCGFEISARSEHLGDNMGLRNYVFEAKTPQIAKEWMEQICAATGTFVLKPKKIGSGYISQIDDSVIHQKQQQKLLTVMQFASSTGQNTTTSNEDETKVQPKRPVSVLAGGRGRGFQKRDSVAPIEAIKELDISKDDSSHQPSPLPSPGLTASMASTAVRRPTMGRGGMGRGAAFRGAAANGNI